MAKKIRLGRYVFRSSALAALLTFGCLGFLLLSVEIEGYRREVEGLRRRTVALHEMSVRSQVEQAVSSLAYRREIMGRQLEERLKERVRQAMAMLEGLEARLRGRLAEAEVRKACIEALARIRYDGGRGYLFVHDEDGRTLLNPPDRSVEGSNELESLPPGIRQDVEALQKEVLERGEAVGRYRWPRPGGTGVAELKITCCQFHRPFGWVLGTGEYLAHFEEEVKSAALDYISRIRFGTQGYVFVDRADGVVLWNPDQSTIGKNRWAMGNPEGLKVAQGVKQALDSSAGTFIHYRWKKPGGGKDLPKLSFVKAFRDWMWVIGAGVYLDEVDETVARMGLELESRLLWRIGELSLLLVVLGLLVAWSLRRFTSRARLGLERFASFFETATTEARPIDSESLPFEEFDHLAELANRMVDERRQADEARHRADSGRHALEKLIDRSPVVTIRLEGGGIWAIRHVSANARRFDWEVEGLVVEGRSFLDMVDEGDREALGQAFEGLIVDETGRELRKSFVIFDGEGGRRWLESWWWADALEDGATVLEGLLLDVSDRMRLEQRLREGERLQAMGQLAGGIAHDFNNQLAAILGYADLLAAQIGDPTLRGYAEFIVRGAQRSADLTRQLLAYTHRGKNLSAAVDLHELLDRTLDLVAHGFGKRLRIERRYLSKVPFTRGDPSLLQNAFMNICINGREAMTGEGTFTVSTEDVELDEAYCAAQPLELAPGAYVKLSFTDTGRGMDEGLRRRVFEPFFTTKGEGSGAGLGLAAVWGTAKSHGGSVSVYSEPGHGTTVSFYLPRGVADEGSVEVPKAGTSRAVRRILVVDDEDLVRRMAGSMLGHLGYEVELFADEEQALSFYRESWQEIDLVLLDMVMPGMGGHELHRRMSTINPDLRCVLASGYSLNDEAQAILDDGVQAFVQKPYRMKALAAVLDDVLSAGRSEG